MNRRELVQNIAADPDWAWTVEQWSEVWAELEYFWDLVDNPRESLPNAIQAHLRCHSVPTRPELKTWLQWASVGSEAKRGESNPSGNGVAKEIRGKAEEMRLAGSIPFARILEGWADRIEEGEPKLPAAIAGVVDEKIVGDECPFDDCYAPNPCWPDCMKWCKRYHAQLRAALLRRLQPGQAKAPARVWVVWTDGKKPVGFATKRAAEEYHAEHLGAYLPDIPVHGAAEGECKECEHWRFQAEFQKEHGDRRAGAAFAERDAALAELHAERQAHEETRKRVVELEKRIGNDQTNNS